MPILPHFNRRHCDICTYIQRFYKKWHFVTFLDVSFPILSLFVHLSVSQFVRRCESESILEREDIDVKKVRKLHLYFVFRNNNNKKFCFSFIFWVLGQVIVPFECFLSSFYNLCQFCNLLICSDLFLGKFCHSITFFQQFHHRVLFPKWSIPTENSSKQEPCWDKELRLDSDPRRARHPIRFKIENGTRCWNDVKSTRAIWIGSSQN